jgi:hypothetical protein
MSNVIESIYCIKYILSRTLTRRTIVSAYKKNNRFVCFNTIFCIISLDTLSKLCRFYVYRLIIIIGRLSLSNKIYKNKKKPFRFFSVQPILMNRTRLFLLRYERIIYKKPAVYKNNFNLKDTLHTCF